MLTFVETTANCIKNGHSLAVARSLDDIGSFRHVLLSSGAETVDERADVTSNVHSHGKHSDKVQSRDDADGRKCDVVELVIVEADWEESSGDLGNWEEEELAVGGFGEGG